MNDTDGFGDMDAGYGGGSPSDAGSQSDAQSAENESQGGYGGGDGGMDTRDMEEQMADPRGVAEQQSNVQGRASEMESQMAAAGMNSDEIAQAMMGFTGLSQAEQEAMLDSIQDAAASHSLSQRTYSQQLKAAYVQAKVAGLKSLGVNARGFGLSLAQDILGLAMTQTLGATVTAIAKVDTLMKALAVELGVKFAVPMITTHIMNMAHKQNVRGIVGVANVGQVEHGSIGMSSDGGGDSFAFGIDLTKYASKYGNDAVFDAVDIVLTVMFGQMYRSQSNIIGSAYDPLRGLLLLR